MIRLKKIYLCDPYKNEECTRAGCLFGSGKAGYCGATSNKKYAVIDPHNGRPILLPEFNSIGGVPVSETIDKHDGGDI